MCKDVERLGWIILLIYALRALNAFPFYADVDKRARRASQLPDGLPGPILSNDELTKPSVRRPQSSESQAMGYSSPSWAACGAKACAQASTQQQPALRLLSLNLNSAKYMQVPTLGKVKPKLCFGPPATKPWSTRPS